MYRHLWSEKMAKTYGWAIISGFIFMTSGLVAGSPLKETVIATTIAVLLKTPFYWGWEHVFYYFWKDAQPHGFSFPVLEVSEERNN